ncbi:MAG: hypothetical protein CMF60_02410 [Magnetococcales bacterium]|nr:hypothetical protein [Magnetococcales bacterium]MEC8066549.1 hypothetical protein [Pseudomonadota bacterium]|tara:strand:- start:2303 stop:2626 length:324 start_codon:yes stop_codon:yes gene_type:complete
MAGEFSLCEFNKQKAIRYHHDFGDFDFLIVQADDGSEDINYYCSIPLSNHAKNTIGFAAIRHLEKTANALKYDIMGSQPNFSDAINILEFARSFLEKQGSTPKPTNR